MQRTKEVWSINQIDTCQEDRIDGAKSVTIATIKVNSNPKTK